MKRESKKPQYQQDDRNSPKHGLTLLFETRFVQAIFLTLSVGQAYTGRLGSCIGVLAYRRPGKLRLLFETAIMSRRSRRS